MTVDAQRNIVRAVAVGATELRTRDLQQREASEEACQSAAATALEVQPEGLELLAKTANFSVYQATTSRTGFLKRFARSRHPICAVDSEGIVRRQLADGVAQVTTCRALNTALREMLSEYTSYSDGGTTLPGICLLLGRRVIDLSGLPRAEHVLSLASTETSGQDGDEPIVLLVERRR